MANSRPTAFADGDDIWIDSGVPFESTNCLSIKQAETFVQDLIEVIAQARNAPESESDV